MAIDKKIIYCDIDNTVCNTSGLDYANAEPLPLMIKNMNWLFDRGHTVVYYTARGAGQHLDLTEMTAAQLSCWGCRYSLLRMDKPIYDVFVDDRSIQPQCVARKDRMPLFARSIFSKKGDLYVCPDSNGGQWKPL